MCRDDVFTLGEQCCSEPEGDENNLMIVKLFLLVKMLLTESSSSDFQCWMQSVFVSS
jgi:hypothetical protein